MTDRTTRVEVNGLLPILLFITFLVLKLTDVIAWSWWWVTAPLWIPAAIMAVVLLVIVLVIAFTRD